MSSRLCAPLTIAVAALLLVAGCGSSSSNKSSSSNNSPTTSSTKTTANSTEKVPSATADRAAKECKANLDRAGQLSADVKKGLEKTCDKAAHGDANAARKAASEVCVKIADQVPQGPARDQAVAACKKTSQ